MDKDTTIDRITKGALFQKINVSEVSEGTWVVYTPDHIYCGYVKGNKEQAEAYAIGKQYLGKFSWVQAIDIVFVRATRPEFDLSHVEGYVG